MSKANTTEDHWIDITKTTPPKGVRVVVMAYIGKVIKDLTYDTWTGNTWVRGPVVPYTHWTFGPKNWE